MKILIDKNFTIAQRNVIDKYLHDAKTKLNLDGKIIKLEIKNSGRLKTSAGNATTSLNNKYGIIKMNKRLFNSTAGLKEFENTFSHELAHILANILNNAHCGHDSRWKNMHKLLGGNAKITHNYKVDHLRPVKREYDYKCNCRTFKLTSRRHNRILRGASYSCRLCGTKISKV